jgi:asparaginyl-tRNA synthetase
MSKTTISQIQDHKDQEVTLKGWLSNKRSSGKLHFLELRDGSGYIQCIVYQDDVPADVFELGDSVTLESSVEVTGIVAEHPKKPGNFELQVRNLVLVGDSPDYPIGKKEHGPDFLLDNRHLWLRSKKQWAIQRIRNTVINAIFEYLNNEGFIKIDTPIITPNACEGTTTLFEIDYFDDPAYLTQTGQLYLEAAIAAHGRVFDFGPVFRAEKSKTRRHLTEFWMMDAEMAFCTLEENLEIQENMICHIVKKVLEKHRKDLEILERDPAPLEKIKAPFVRMTHAEAVAELNKKGSDIKITEDLGGDDETLLTQDKDVPVFVTHWPKDIKAFYMKRDEAGEHALCADLIATEGFGETIGGSQREDDYDELLKRIEEHKLPLDDFQWYLDARKYGSVPHGGFGIGLERTVGWMCGTKHVRETIPFPRLLNRMRP